MNYKILDENNKQEVVALFTSTFSSSEGEGEGKIIGNLASELFSNIDNNEIIYESTEKRDTTSSGTPYTGCSGTYIFAWEMIDNETKSEIGGFRRR